MDFNPTYPRVMHVDINSCFATIEQQANPTLRGLPIAVAAYNSPGGCILAPSVEAKKFGIKTGMRVADGKRLCPALRVLSPDPDKYRFVHKKLHKLLDKFCPEVYPKSIDEFVLNFASQKEDLVDVSKNIKLKIRKSIGEWISVSIGISVNRQLAKVAAGIVKPDGLVLINKDNFWQIYKNLKLTDLNGINTRNEARLNSVGIYTVQSFYKAPLWKLKAAFKSILAFYWYMRLRGYEVDDIEFGRKSFGNSYAIPQNLTSATELAPILAKLVNKTASRLRAGGYRAHGVHISISFKTGSPRGEASRGGYWHKGQRLPQPIFYTSDIFREAVRILKSAEIVSPVHTLSVSVYDLVKSPPLQLSLIENVEKKQFLAETIDQVNRRFGSFVLMTANMLSAGSAVKDRIAFGQTDTLDIVSSH